MTTGGSLIQRARGPELVVVALDEHVENEAPATQSARDLEGGGDGVLPGAVDAVEPAALIDRPDPLREDD